MSFSSASDRFFGKTPRIESIQLVEICLKTTFPGLLGLVSWFYSALDQLRDQSSRSSAKDHHTNLKHCSSRPDSPLTPHTHTIAAMSCEPFEGSLVDQKFEEVLESWICQAWWYFQISCCLFGNSWRRVYLRRSNSSINFSQWCCWRIKVTG